MQAASRQAVAGAGDASTCAACCRGAGSSAVQHCQLDNMSMLQEPRLATRMHAVPCQAEGSTAQRSVSGPVTCLLPFLSRCITPALPLTTACNPESLP